MWSAKITVLNTKTLQEYRIWHDRMMEEADVVITYNRSNHFNAAGKFCFQMIHFMTHNYCLENTNEQPNDPH